jgi:sec-independent protein translocase protein TatA
MLLRNANYNLHSLASRSFSYEKEKQMAGLGFPEMVVILIIALVIFGPNRLPALGESLGKAIRGFKEGLQDKPEAIEKNHEEKIKA